MPAQEPLSTKIAQMARGGTVFGDKGSFQNRD